MKIRILAAILTVLLFSRNEAPSGSMISSAQATAE